jgi:aspartyl-tRNA(Asn)/glutamyl-tRNA(Gln) amidotransferase subunit C
MLLSDKDVRHIAKLARLGLSDAEIKKFQAQLSGILEYSRMLDEVDTKGVEPIAQITGLTNVSFADEPDPSPISNALLEQSPQQVIGHMIKVKSVF